eukprot:CAMPEP_0183759408 /NCGR_PEP_ID=MMETSP0739-20130205/7077_1 /TAXON_ID=385413 /ORGANISM="Thalassiosira miniscula, Strain CCMP1093" /LENGTH=257 /DNA_ID=CAMNT_0025997195 /DNA_START=234 /DNA_END=1007 /DNA_ORIENTATION=+
MANSDEKSNVMLADCSLMNPNSAPSIFSEEIIGRLIKEAASGRGGFNRWTLQRAGGKRFTATDLLRSSIESSKIIPANVATDGSSDPDDSIVPLSEIYTRTSFNRRLSDLVHIHSFRSLLGKQPKIDPAIIHSTKSAREEQEEEEGNEPKEIISILQEINNQDIIHFLQEKLFHTESKNRRLKSKVRRMKKEESRMKRHFNSLIWKMAAKASKEMKSRDETKMDLQNEVELLKQALEESKSVVSEIEVFERESLVIF